MIILNSSACNVLRFVLYSHLQKIQGHKREYKICLPFETIPDIMSLTWCNKKVTYFKIHPGNLYQYTHKTLMISIAANRIINNYV